MALSIAQRYVRGAVCAIILIPLVFLAVYPVLTMVLPDRLAILTDLPQDLMMVLILDGAMVPLIGVALYVRARKRANRRGPAPGRDSRDVF